jgi:trigger factor
MTLDQLREQMRPMAEKQVKVRLALEKIAALENLTVADEEIEAEYQRISDAYQVPMEQVKAMIDAKDIAADMRVKAAMDLVKEKAVIAKPAAPKAAKKTTKAASDAEKPAKSTTAKTKTASTKSTGTKATASKTAGAKSAPKTTKTKKADASKESESK